MEYSALGSVVFHPDKPHAAESQRIRTERGASRKHAHARIPTQPRRTHRRRPAVPDRLGELPYQPQVGVLLNSPERLRHAEFRLEHQRRAEFVDQSALPWYSELLRKIRAYHSDLFQCDHFALLSCIFPRLPFELLPRPRSLPQGIPLPKPVSHRFP